MPITKDGFYKSISKNTSIGDNSYVLLAGGGHRKTGNNGPSSDGDNYYSYSYIPLSNSVLNKYLNADMVDSLHVHTGINNEANKIVRTSSNGIIYTGTIDTISSRTIAINNGTSILKKIYVSNTGNPQYISYIYPEDFYSNFENSGNNVSLTIGGYNRTLEISYATTSYIADNAKQSFRLKGDSTYTAWGQNYWTNGIPNSISGDMTSVGNITPISNKTKSSGSSSNEWLNVYTYNLISNSTLYINSSNDASIIFKKGNTELGRFYYNNGYLGLNVQIPAQRLHVNGNAYITNRLYIVGNGNFIGSDANNKNLYLSVNGKYINFAQDENAFRRGTATTNDNITLGTNTYPWYATYSSGFYHTGLTSSVLGDEETRDDYVILGGGGYKKLSDFSMSHDHPYLPLAGGTMTGTIYRNYTVASNEPMLSLASNNQDVWLWRIKDYGTGSATSTSKVYGFGLKYIGTGNGINNKLSIIADNQTSTAVTALDINQSGQVSIGANLSNSTSYMLTVNGTTSTGLITTSGAAITTFDKVYAANGNSEVHPITKANFLNGLLQLTSTAVGSIAIPIYWTGTKFATVQATFGSQNYGEHNANNIKSNGLWYYSNNGPTTNHGASTVDGALYSQAYSTSWTGQIAQDYRNGNIFVRGLNNGTWQPWKAIATADYEYGINPAANVIYNPRHKQFTVVGGTNNSWDTEVYSYSGYKECTLTFKVDQVNSNIIVGLSGDGVPMDYHTSLKFGWYMKTSNALYIIESGTELQIGNYFIGDEFTIKYSDGVIKYFHNGVLCRVVDYDLLNEHFHMDAFFYNSSGKIYDINFRPAYDDDNIEIIDLRYY